MQAEFRCLGQHSPGGGGLLCRCPLHQQAGALQLTVPRKAQDRLIHFLGQTKVIGMNQGWRGLGSTLLQAEASSPAPDQGIQHRWGEHQQQSAPCRMGPVRQQQRQQGADAQIDAVLQDQPAAGKATPTGLLPEGHQGMAEVTRHGRSQKRQRVGQPARNHHLQADQHREMHNRRQNTHSSVAP